jgi:endonuclease/exonuclease/phosphatase family metal-dependent hydrolase
VLLVSYNIQYGKGIDGRFDIARSMAEIAKADIIALQEVESFWTRTGMVDQPSEIAKHFPEHHYVFGVNYDMDASYRDGGKLVNRRRRFGNMVLSRWPIVSARNFLLPKFGSVVNHIMQRGILETVTGPPRQELRVLSTHLCHLSPGTRMPQVEYVIERLREAPAEGGAWTGDHPNPEEGWTEGGEPPMPRDIVLMGDMNFDQFSAEYNRILGPVSKRHGRIPAREGLMDAWVVAGNKEEAGDSHPNGGRIDHCFISTHLRKAVKRCWIDGKAVGSDHYPLWTELER